MILLEGVKPQYAVILPGVHAEAIITHPFNVSHGAQAEIATCIFESSPSRPPATFADLLSDHLENGVVYVRSYYVARCETMYVARYRYRLSRGKGASEPI